MSVSDLAKLIFLAAIWGGSFIFMRIAVPEVGVIPTAALRMLLAGLVLLVFARFHNAPLFWRKNLKPYAMIGFFSAALPFSCFSFASQYLPSAYSAILNSTAPLFGAVFSVFWLSDKLSLRKLCGLLLGISGVSVLVGAGSLAIHSQTLLAIFACLCAAASYSISSILIKKTGQKTDSAAIHPYALASGTLLLGGLMLVPALPFCMPEQMPSILAFSCAIALSLLSSALAQAIFIPLIVRIGPTRAMSVTFLIPVFGMLWGYLFLHEQIRASTIAGAAIILMAMNLILRSGKKPAAT